MPDPAQPRNHGEDGIALLITVVVMLLLSAVAVTSLQRAQDENFGAGSSRRKVATVAAADAALNVVELQLRSGQTQFPDVSSLSNPDFLQDHYGFSTSVRTGTIDSSTPQPSQTVGSTYKEGSQINVNAPNTFSYGVYRTGVVATDQGG